MPVPNPVMPVKGAGTTLWVYKGSGDPYANPLSDVDWSRLAKVKDLTPGELTAESYDNRHDGDTRQCFRSERAEHHADRGIPAGWRNRQELPCGVCG